ncbi:MAG: hypothetical protein NVSMB19_16370 [Vulcanimicrobiaceae bacterium]
MASEEDTVIRVERATADRLPALVWTTSADGAVTTSANGRWFEYAGYDVTHGAGDVIHPDDRSALQREWERVRDGGSDFDLQYRIRHRSGVFRWHAVRAAPLHDRAGRLDGWCATALAIDGEGADDRSFRVVAETLPHMMMWVAHLDGSPDYWNERLVAYAGMRPEKSLGLAWEAIVHPEDYVATARAWSGAVETSHAYESKLRLRRHDGIFRWFSVRAVPVFGRDGLLERFAGTATDIDEQERAAIALEFFDRVGDLLGAQIEVGETLQSVAERAVPALADWCTIYLHRADDSVEPVAVAHRSPELVAAAWRMLRQYPPRGADAAIERVLQGRSTLAASLSPEQIAAAARDERHRELLGAFDIRCAIVAPLLARGVAIGSVQLVSGAGRTFDADDLRVAEILGKRLGAAIDNAQIHERERLISTTFQQAALSHALPSVPGIDLHAVYVAAEREAEIGGDWYDAFTLDNEHIVISIGDVAGKGLEAAVLMGSLRQAIRVVALLGFSPGEILEATSRLVQRESPEKFATAFVAIVDPATWSMRYATAAHPQPLLRRPDGSTVFLTAEPAPPLGLIVTIPRDHQVVSIPPKSLLVLYTDGLVEATRDLAQGEARLRASVASNAVLHSGDPARLIHDTVLHDGVHDDVAVLTIAFGRSKRWSFDARDAMSAHGARSSFVAALHAEGDDAGDYIGSEVIFGELIGNVVRHAPGPIDVTLDWSEEEPFLHVIDRGPGFVREPLLPENMFAESGRGLYIIDTLARNFSAVPIPGRGTHVTVRLPVQRRGP